MKDLFQILGLINYFLFVIISVAKGDIQIFVLGNTCVMLLSTILENQNKSLLK